MPFSEHCRASLLIPLSRVSKDKSIFLTTKHRSSTIMYLRVTCSGFTVTSLGTLMAEEKNPHMVSLCSLEYHTLRGHVTNIDIYTVYMHILYTYVYCI